MQRVEYLPQAHLCATGRHRRPASAWELRTPCSITGIQRVYPAHPGSEATRAPTDNPQPFQAAVKIHAARPVFLLNATKQHQEALTVARKIVQRRTKWRSYQPTNAIAEKTSRRLLRSARRLSPSRSTHTRMQLRGTTSRPFVQIFPLSPTLESNPLCITTKTLQHLFKPSQFPTPASHPPSKIAAASTNLEVLLLSLKKSQLILSNLFQQHEN